jgi:hypothetical protein
MRKHLLFGFLFGVSICLYRPANAQAWHQTPVKDLAVIDFPCVAKITDTLGVHVISCYNDSATFLVMVNPKMPQSGTVDEVSLLRSSAQGHLEAEKAQVTNQFEVTIDGKKALETWHVLPPNPGRRQRGVRYLRSVYHNNRIISCEVMTYPELEGDKNLEALKQRFFNSMRLKPAAPNDPAGVSAAPGTGNDSLNSISHRIGYLTGKMLAVGLLLGLGILLFKKLRR